MTAKRGDVVLVDYPFTPGGAKVRPALVVGDENPMREPESWRQKAAERLKIPLWTVDADVIVPSKLLLKEQYGAYTARPRIHRLLDAKGVLPSMLTSPSYADVLRQASSRPARDDMGGGASPEARGVVRNLIQ